MRNFEGGAAGPWEARQCRASPDGNAAAKGGRGGLDGGAAGVRA